MELCICLESSGTEKISVEVEKRKYNKSVTIVSGLPSPEKYLKKLKGLCACGGCIKNKKIEVQGDHMVKIKKWIQSNIPNA